MGKRSRAGGRADRASPRWRLEPELSRAPGPGLRLFPLSLRLHPPHRPHWPSRQEWCGHHLPHQRGLCCVLRAEAGHPREPGVLLSTRAGQPPRCPAQARNHPDQEAPGRDHLCLTQPTSYGVRAGTEATGCLLVSTPNVPHSRFSDLGYGGLGDHQTACSRPPLWGSDRQSWPTPRDRGRLCDCSGLSALGRPWGQLLSAAHPCPPPG